MNAELIGIITVGIVLLGVGIAIVAQSEEIQTILQIEGILPLVHLPHQPEQTTKNTVK